MRHQMDAIRESQWDLLVVLDACRADYFTEIVPDAETVLTPGRNTCTWVARMSRLLNERKVTYFSANPIVDHENEIRHRHLKLVSLWQKHWGSWGACNMATVHPASAVAAYLELCRGIPGPHVLHLMQPHSPYIGEVSLPCIAALKRNLAFYPGVPTVADAIADGTLTWELLRDAYRSNLRLIWQAVQLLFSQVDGQVVVTGDHGEFLGEYGGLFGHSHRRPYRKTELTNVPWHVRECQGAPLNRMERLAALGYV